MSETAYQKPAPEQSYTRLTVTAPTAAEEPLTMALFEQGAEGVQVDDPELIRRHLQAGDWDASVFREQDLPQGSVTLTTLLPDPQLAAAAAAAVQALAQAEGWPLQLSLSEQPPVDWQQEWKKAFTPLSIGGRLWVAPYWLADQRPPERLPLLIDPGMAFGTGDHATTALALELLEQYIQPGDRVLDLGCGSGILALAALALGATAGTAVDIDPICGPSLARHRQLNQVEEARLPFICGDVLSEEKLQRQLRRDKAQIVLANINAAVLSDLAGIVGRFMAPNAYLICTGVLDEYSAAVAERLTNACLTMIRVCHRDGWTAYVCTPAFE